jgi:hypothetical protein
MYPIATPNWCPVDIFSTLQNPSPYAQNQFQHVLTVSGYQGMPIYLYSSFYAQNAMAVSKPIYQPFQPNVLSHYERYIIYNPNFMRHMEFASGNQFVTLSIFAHELGHHFYGHADVANLGEAIHPHYKECDAEYYSGFVLAKLGAKPADLELTQRLIFSMWSSETHPDSFKRISSIVKGWKAGGGVGIAEDDLVSIYQKIMNELNRWN